MFGEDNWFYVLVAAVAVIAAGYGLSVWGAERRRTRVVVDERFTGLLVSKGRVERVLEPGAYTTAFTDDAIELYDMREQSQQVAGQEVLTKDLMPVRISLIMRWRIADVKTCRGAHNHPHLRIHDGAQVELRRRTAAVSLEEVLAAREALAEGFAAALAATAGGVGVAILAVEVRDIVLAGPARQAFFDIWKAKKEGEAALERARGEQASLRSLANAARMLKGNPELMNLRLLQTLAGGPGKSAPTVVLGGGAGLLPVQAGPAAEMPEAKD